MSEDKKKIEDALLVDVSEADKAIILAFQEKTGLSLLTQQINAIKKGNKHLPAISINGARLLAERTKEYEGQTAPAWCGADGKWKDAWLLDTPPVAAKIGVYRKGFKEAVFGICRFSAYNNPNSPTWKKLHDTMLAKCAEMQAFRKAFPAEFSGVYLPEELEGQDGFQQEEKKPTQSQPTPPKEEKISLADQYLDAVLANAPGWQQIGIPDSLLPKDLAGKNLTAATLVNNEFLEWTASDGTKKTASMVAEIWANHVDGKTATVGKKVLALRV